MENKVLNFSSGEVIFEQGVYESWFYDILSGKVGIYVEYGTENEKLLTTLEAGQTFGEMGMIECYPRSATAVSLEDAQLVKIDSDTFSSYFTDKPEKLIAIMRQMSQRVRELTKDYMDACKALTESVEAETNENKKKSLKAKLKKFLDDYMETACSAAEFDPSRWHYYGMF